ncbi:MAG TPA: 3-oxoadipate enol-lactonase [Beijerinckiaceae bacterium]|jgi:3-oxoadipate enol-lactonase/4-carboxymuconolactone decarboxylase
MPLTKANGVELFYDLAGPEGAPVVAFSNSLGTTHAMWDLTVPALCDRYRCLRYDTRGHGGSAIADRPASIDDLADDLAGLLDALGIERAHVVGLSLGGMTAQAFAVRHPGRLEKLVLMATSAHMPPPDAWQQRADTVRRDGMAAIVDAVVARWFTPAFAEVDPRRLAAVRDEFLRIDPRGYAVCCEAIRDMDLRERIGAIRAPTLIVAGADDPATPVAMLEDIRGRILDAELLIVPRAAHLVVVERAGIVNAHLAAFLDRGAAARPSGAAFEAGLANRKKVLGDAHVERSLANAGPFATPWQDFITRMAWGEIWGDPTIPWKTRSMVTLAMMVALHREEEFKLHVRPALRNGVTVEELRSLLLQTSIYAGVPAANAAFRWVREVLGDELK